MSIPFTTISHSDNAELPASEVFWNEIFYALAVRTDTFALGNTLGISVPPNPTLEQAIEWITNLGGEDAGMPAKQSTLQLLMDLLVRYQQWPEYAITLESPPWLSFGEIRPPLYDPFATQANRQLYNWIPRYRDKPPTQGGTLIHYGYPQPGDIFGPWIVKSFQNLLIESRVCRANVGQANNGNFVVAPGWQSATNEMPYTYTTGRPKRFWCYRTRRPQEEEDPLIAVSEWTTAGLWTFHGVEDPGQGFEFKGYCEFYPFDDYTGYK